MPRISYHSTFLRERLERVARDEPSGFDVVFCKQFQQSANANCTGEETLRNSQSVRIISLRHTL